MKKSILLFTIIILTVNLFAQKNNAYLAVQQLNQFAKFDSADFYLILDSLGYKKDVKGEDSLKIRKAAISVWIFSKIKSDDDAIRWNYYNKSIKSFEKILTITNINKTHKLILQFKQKF